MSDAEAVRLAVERAPDCDRMFWLDGGGARRWSGRRSILGFLDEDDVSLTFDASRGEVVRHRSGSARVIGSDVFASLEDEIGADAGDRTVSWVGYFGYACRSDLAARPDPDVPDAVWMRVRDPVVVDHPEVSDAARERDGRPEGPVRPVPPRLSAPSGDLDPPAVPADYAADFAAVQAELRRGNSYEVNLTYREAVESDVDPLAAYLRLRALSPAPYAGFLRHRGVALLSSSPERFATLDGTGGVETKPIKGTTLRGTTPEQDEHERIRLSHDPRYRAENLMIVDLLRNDLATVCAPGTVEVPDLMQVESYPGLHQLVSTVRGRLREEVSTPAALRALFPAGSMTGAPKRRTMEIIDRVETTPRGVYAGAFGWIGADGRADLGVVIRSLVARSAGGGWTYTLGTGGGITVRSDVESEYAETRWKALRLHAALDLPGTSPHSGQF